MTDSRLAVIGDVGGHLDSLVAQLNVLGVDVEERLVPPELVVCQVGDLVHKGPESAAVVALVDELMARNPDRWIQLLGNHEAQYLPDCQQFWTPTVDEKTAETIRRWWDSGQVRIAAAFDVIGDGGDGIAVDRYPRWRHAWLLEASRRAGLSERARRGSQRGAVTSRVASRNIARWLRRHVGRTVVGCRHLRAVPIVGVAG